MADTHLLQIEHLDKSFYATHAVRDVSFHVDSGEIVALLGENGAGKSTVIKMMAGVHKPDAGRIFINGADIEHARDQVAFVHQTLGLIDWMTVEENISQVLGYPRRFGLIDTRASRQRAREVLDLVGGGIDPDTRVFDLPRTERSLLAIARALVSDPKLLVLDEPTASLPAADVERLFEVLATLRNTGVGMVYVSHRLDEVYEISSRTVIMRNGQVVADRPVDGLDHRELVQLIVGKELEGLSFDPPKDEVRLAVHDLVVQGIGPVSVDVRGGEIVALCGLRGAGEEQVGRALAGILQLDHGQIRVDGEPVPSGRVSDAVDRGIGFATSKRETEAVAPGLSVRENLYLNPAVWGRNLFQPYSPASERRDAYREVVRFGVRPPDPELDLDTLSGGNQQKVILARWLAAGRKVLILEEPTMGVDVGSKAEIYALLRDAAREGLATVIISTDMEEVARIAHRAIVMERGAVAAVLEGADVTISNLISAASGLATTTTAGAEEL